MMVMMGIRARRILIRMSPLTMTGEVRVGITAVWDALVNDVSRRMGMDEFRSRDGGHPGWTAEPSFVLTFLVAGVVIVSIVGNDEVAITSGEGRRGR